MFFFCVCRTETNMIKQHVDWWRDTLLICYVILFPFICLLAANDLYGMDVLWIRTLLMGFIASLVLAYAIIAPIFKRLPPIDIYCYVFCLTAFLFLLTFVRHELQISTQDTFKFDSLDPMFIFIAIDLGLCFIKYAPLNCECFGMHAPPVTPRVVTAAPVIHTLQPIAVLRPGYTANVLSEESAESDGGGSDEGDDDNNMQEE
jgi:hypothetical protein